MDRHIKILIVEDEQIVALDLKRRLTKLGYDVIGTAASGDKAFALISQELPSVVLMDIHIQGEMDGVEVAARLQEKHSIPVIYLTAYSEEKTLSRARATMPYGYLLKPFSDRELHVMIQVSMERFENDTRIAKSEEHFRLALEAARLGTWEATEEKNEIFLSKSQNGNLEPISDWKKFDLSIDKRDKNKVSDFIQKLRLNKGAAEEIEFRVNSDSGKEYWYKLYGKSFISTKPYKYQVIGVLQETTEIRHVQNRLAQAATVFECATEGIILLKNRKFHCANKAFYTITEFEENDILDKELTFLTERFLGESAYNRLWRYVEESGHWQGEIKTYKKNKEAMYIWINIGRIPVKNDDDDQSVVMISDITTVRKTQEQLARIAFYDCLTNLPNRMLVMDRLKFALEKAKRESLILGVLFIDLDNFKRINDTLGHKAGDNMLRLISQKIQSELRKSDTLGRLGGDEFIVIAADVDSKDALTRIAEKILDCLSAPVIVEGMEIIPSCSIGISVYPEHSDHHDALVQMADTAMYQAKSSGRNMYAYYHPCLTQKASHFLMRERELYQALERNEFILHYQPQFSSSDRKVTSVEALIRWQHPEKGLLFPSEIIPVAESSKLMVEIGNWVLAEACRQLNVWRSEGLSDLGIAVNMSIRQFSDARLTKLIDQLLHQYGLPAHSLELEITESCLQDDLVDNAHLRELEKSGISISIDDFGTGYSCMSSLKNLPIHKLKIDRSFIKDIPHDKNDCAIASAILALGKELNLKVVAEGIEFPEQVDFLDAHGCDEFQGFLFSKPVLPGKITELIKSQANYH
ncbi:diguanylate cyclase (GGDEF) domain-containing protein [Nitrosomonas marina]|uniref:Diguanylate cyclase (GGDEF) domain-containing protein n=1 Tax=Nitrosomonas marina TaxID=917 RepID=A0A1I0DGW9_9PROT|nr:EAL domain-containing protein [Nitrosomonas marina]SET31440.1 diguanylate cyclase (GGDEF) domain-containing protein [Nitrosomonas marina]